MMATKVIAFTLLFIVCSRASPLRTANMYDSPLIAIPIFVRDLENPEAEITDEDEPIYMLSNEPKVTRAATSPLDVAKRSADKVDDYDDLETAAGTNILRPLFVYRQQIAYRQRVRDANRRGRRI